MPVGLVHSRMAQLAGGQEEAGGSPANELLKKHKGQVLIMMRDQRRLWEVVPAGRNENPMFELSGSGATRRSSRTS